MWVLSCDALSQAKLPLSFVPSDELAFASKGWQEATSNHEAAQQQQQQPIRAGRDGLSEEERKVYERLVRFPSRHSQMNPLMKKQPLLQWVD